MPLSDSFNMKKRLLILFILSNITLSLSAQTFSPNKEKIYQSLIGEVYLFSLFIDTEEEDWEEEEINYYYTQLLESEAWLTDQATYYDQVLSFENDYFIDNKQQIYLNDIRRGQSAKRTVNKALVELGYDDFEDFLEKTNFDFSKNRLKMVFFVKKKDRSHAINYFSNKDLDIAIVYCKSTYGRMTNHHVISHEILHQFGAWDLYNGESQSAEFAEKAIKLYPNSIMINVWRNRDNLEVDELTAWRIGWHYDYQEAFAQFDPNEKKRIKTKSKKGTSIKFDLKRKNRNKD